MNPVASPDSISGRNQDAVASSIGPEDPQYPFNFTLNRKRLVLVVGVIWAFSSTLGSSLPSGATISLSQHFGIPRGSTSLVLLNSLYMIGFVVSPLICAPISEGLGRRPMLVGSYTFYTIFTLCCAVAPTYWALILFRLLAGSCAAVPHSVIAGLYSDTFSDFRSRGRAMASFMFVGAQGPFLGPLLSGFISVNLGWKWVFWVALIIAGIGLPIVWLLPETYVPVLEKRVNGESWRAIIREQCNLRCIGTLLIRPGMMIISEPILLLSSLYMALIYATTFLFFQAYPIVYGTVYGLSQDQVGLAYVPMIVGATIAFMLFHAYGAIFARAEKQQRPWAESEDYRRLPLACIGGPCIPIALLALGFTATPDIHPVVSMATCGIFFGTGYLLIFFAITNYLSDVFKRYAASAHAAAGTTRSIFAVALPFAAPSMYDKLGVKYASILLAAASSIMALIPVAFILMKSKLRARSKFAD